MKKERDTASFRLSNKLSFYINCTFTRIYAIYGGFDDIIQVVITEFSNAAARSALLRNLQIANKNKRSLDIHPRKRVFELSGNVD